MARSFAPNKNWPRRSPIRGATILICALYAMTFPGPALAQSSEPTFGAVIASCEACHGAGGDSRSTEIPRLNGQRIDYMMGRLDILGDPLRSVHPNDAMWRIVSDMNSNIREDIAKYFAAQTPMAGRPEASGTRGREIYEHGVPNEGVLACSLCHGAVGEGQDLAPRIAGQHSNYLKAQILEFNSTARPHGTMNNDEHKLTGAQLEAVIDYLGNE
jgi:cytochrome c553